MCTITLIARRHGYLLGMNRDEKLARPAALPPERRRVGDREAMFPSEPAGGTWIAVNDAGITFALINWYSVNARVSGPAVSRGEVVKAAVALDSPARVDARFADFPMPRVNPFRLIGVFPGRKQIFEWRWDLAALRRVGHPWRSNTWISSGYDERGAQQARHKAFRKALRQRSAGTVDWLRRLHRSHGAERGAYSHCMHRLDAATVSCTLIRVSNRSATVHYHPGAPCCSSDACVRNLELAATAGDRAAQRCSPRFPRRNLPRTKLSLTSADWRGRLPPDSLPVRPGTICV